MDKTVRTLVLTPADKRQCVVDELVHNVRSAALKPTDAIGVMW